MSYFSYNHTSPSAIYTLSLHDALPISQRNAPKARGNRGAGAAQTAVSRRRSDDRELGTLVKRRGQFRYLEPASESQMILVFGLQPRLNHAERHQLAEPLNELRLGVRRQQWTQATAPADLLENAPVRDRQARVLIL